MSQVKNLLSTHTRNSSRVSSRSWFARCSCEFALVVRTSSNVVRTLFESLFVSCSIRVRTNLRTTRRARLLATRRYRYRGLLAAEAKLGNYEGQHGVSRPLLRAGPPFPWFHFGAQRAQSEHPLTRIKIQSRCDKGGRWEVGG